MFSEANVISHGWSTLAVLMDEALAKPLGPPASSGRPEGLCS